MRAILSSRHYSDVACWNKIEHTAPALGHRESTVAKVRTQLQNNAAWKKWSEDKHNIRTEGVVVIAGELK